MQFTSTCFSTTSLSSLKGLLLCVFAVSLLLAGCDSSGSDEDPDRWVGNWKQTDGEGFEGDANFAISLSREQVKTTERADCTTRTMNVTNVEIETEGDKATITLEDGGVYELTVQPNANRITVDFPDGRSEFYASADDSKTTEEIVVGCP